MTRRLRTLVALATTILAAAVLALPAAATEGEAVTTGATLESGFGTGQWDGLIVTAIAGIVLGIVAFAVSDPGGIPRAGSHH